MPEVPRVNDSAAIAIIGGASKVIWQVDGPWECSDSFKDSNLLSLGPDEWYPKKFHPDLPLVLIIYCILLVNP